jgi:hypothetical protein
VNDNKGRLVVIREGHGEAGAIENLVIRTIQHLGLFHNPFSALPPSNRFTITSPGGAIRAAQIAATQYPGSVLLTADLDDGCPADVAPARAAALRAEAFSFPVALVFFHREFETLAVSIAGSLAGRELRSPAGRPILTLATPSVLLENPEQPRDAKGWVARELMGGVKYKPTVHQLPLTRVMDIEALQVARLSSFRRLESALLFLAREVREARAGVYPPAATKVF